MRRHVAAAAAAAVALDVDGGGDGCGDDEDDAWAAGQRQFAARRDHHWRDVGRSVAFVLGVIASVIACWSLLWGLKKPAEANVDAQTVGMLIAARKPPSPNLWDDEREGPGGHGRLLGAARTRAERERALNATVHALYCDFQRLNASELATPGGLERLGRVRLDRPIILYDAVPRAQLRRWTPDAAFLRDEYADVNLTVTTITAEAGDDARPTRRIEAVRLRDYVRAGLGGRLGHAVVQSPLWGSSFAQTAVLPWFEEFAEAVAPLDAAVEDALVRAGVAPEYFVGPWRSAIEKMRGAFADAASMRDTGYEQTFYHNAARNAAGSAFRALTRQWAAWARGNLTGEAFMARLAAGDFALPPHLFLGPHLAGTDTQLPERSVHAAMHGYRVWLAASDLPDLSAGLAEVKEADARAVPFLFLMKYFNASAYAYGDGGARASVGLCSQPPGSLVFMPRMWWRTDFAWDEDGATGRPVPIDARAGGLTVSLAYLGLSP